SISPEFCATWSTAPTYCDSSRATAVTLLSVAGLSVRKIGKAHLVSLDRGTYRPGDKIPGETEL
ncbi:hypothetical protein ACC723_37860, partial [Rhizobium ruizarguesonis]